MLTLMVQYKSDVTPVQMHWSYICFVQTHRFYVKFQQSGASILNQSPSVWPAYSLPILRLNSARLADPSPAVEHLIDCQLRSSIHHAVNINSRQSRGGFRDSTPCHWEWASRKINPYTQALTHYGLVTPYGTDILVNTGLDNGLLSVRCQAIT